MRMLDGDLSEIFGIEVEPIETVPRALGSLVRALGQQPGRDAQVLREALSRLEQVSAPLAQFPAAALLRGFEIIGQQARGTTARKLGLMATELRTIVRAHADDHEVISLWNAVIALARKQRGREWSATAYAWIDGLRTLRQTFGLLD